MKSFLPLQWEFKQNGSIIVLNRKKKHRLYFSLFKWRATLFDKYYSLYTIRFFSYNFLKGTFFFTETRQINKRPMCHIAHLSNQFNSISTFQQSYGYIITLIRCEKKPLSPSWELKALYFVKSLSPVYPRMLCVKFCWNWPSDSGEEDFKIRRCFFATS